MITYGTEYQEYLDDNIDDTIERAIIDEQEFPIEVLEFKHMDAAEDKTRLAEYALDKLLENLDDDYGGEEPAYKVTEGMKQAAQEFVTKVLNDYVVWRCEPTGRVYVVDTPESEPRLKWITGTV